MPQMIRLTVLSLIMLLCFAQCKEKQNGLIPYVAINTSIGINQPSYANLLPIGGYVYLNGYGARGLIIYHKDVNEYVAYDRNCTFNGFATSCNTLTVNQSLGQAQDTCCGSSFSLYTGQVINGPANAGMVQYQTELSGQLLYIYN